MKKLLSILFIAQAFIAFSQAPTTCSNDAVFVALNKPGIWPDSATNFVQGMVGVPYGQNITEHFNYLSFCPMTTNSCFR